MMDHQQKGKTATNKTEATTMQRYSECKFCWCNVYAIFLNTHVDCYTLLFLLSRSGHAVKYWGWGNLIANII
jgi:hypothetical protein